MALQHDNALLLLTKQNTNNFKLAVLTRTMSIKSQKSLNEECSEIFERSYSVRSPSEDSFTTEDEESLSRELLRKLSPAALSRLRRRFRRAAVPQSRRLEEVMRAAALQEGVQFAPRPAHPSDGLFLDEDGFVSAIDDIFGPRRYTAHARHLCAALDPLRSGRVLWAALLEKLLPAARPPRARAVLHRCQKLPHCQRECIVKLVSIEREGTFCYAAVTRGGRVGVYSGNLELLHSYEVFRHRATSRRRITNCWVTDAVYMNDAACVAYATSERCVRVFTAQAPAHAPLHCLSGLPDVPTCLAYRAMSDVRAADGAGSVLLVGTARGALCSLRFLQPRAALLPHSPDAPEAVSYHSWTEVCASGTRSHCVAWSLAVHARGVRRVACSAGASRLLSCSHDAVCSLRVTHASPHLRDYVFKVQRGISCFDAAWSLGVVATGSRDGAMRLWEVTQSSPYATLTHPGAAPVLDVAVVARLELVVAFHGNCTLNVWDLHEECMLQSIKIKFPFFGVLGKKVEFGTYCIHPGPARRKAILEDTPQGSSSRRSKNGPSSGENGEDGMPGDHESDAEYDKFEHLELLVTCCEYVCRVTLGGAGDAGDAVAAVLPPPSGTMRARRPHHWDLPDDWDSDHDAPVKTAAVRVKPPSPLLPHPARLPIVTDDAQLKGQMKLLQRDFTLMLGLKSDLNRKLNQLKTTSEARRWAVRSGAPHLALAAVSPPPVLPPPAAPALCRSRLTLQFPPPSVGPTPTPTDSGGSTPLFPRAEL